MSPKRPRLVDRSPSSSSSNEALRKNSKIHDTSLRLLRVHIVPAKIDSVKLWALNAYLDAGLTLAGSEGHGKLQLAQALNEDGADVIVTAVRMKKRLQRHIDWDIASSKIIVTPKWLEASVNAETALPFDNYTAISELAKQNRTVSSSNSWFLDASITLDNMNCLVPVDKAQSEADIHHLQLLSCLRLSPLECPNQGLAKELAVLMHSRELEGQIINALGYERAISSIKSYPSLITTESIGSHLAKLPYVGEKILSKIIEYVEDGEIAESRSIATSQRFQSLSTFSRVYGIGPTTARILFDRGVRTLHDLQRYYDVYTDDPDEDNAQTSGKIEGVPYLSRRVGILLLSELEQAISRDEVEEIHKAIMEELELLQPGCVSTITGGYRRGKAQSNDVDIVISHQDFENGGELVKGLCEKLVTSLCKQGLVTHVMHLSGFHEHNALRTTHWDSLQKSLTVFRLPDDGSKQHLHRRVDLIFAQPEVYWTAITGWTGSKMFERDLRQWAKNHGLKFDSSGITRRRDSKLFFPRSEQEVFHILGLPWIDPTMRNADI